MRRPALNTVIPYTLGILVAGFLPIPAFWIWLIVLIFLIGSFVLQHRPEGGFRVGNIENANLPRIFLLLAIFGCGILRVGIALTPPCPSELYNQPVRFSGHMTYQPSRGELWETGYAIGTVESVSAPDLTVKMKVLIRFYEPVALRYGDWLEVEGVFRQPKGQRNPGGFDYRAYLTRRQVFGIFYPNRHQEISPTHQAGLPPLRWTERLRRRVEVTIDRLYHEQPDHVHILKGMLLGKRSELPDSTLDIFRNSGSLHVLAVSGLHVGLISALCFLSFSLLGLPRKTVCLLTIAAVILYACLVGFRPSVLRASFMAILFLIAQIIDRDADLINLLAFAALVLLLINPAQLWDVGFQLSFAAVACIVYLLPKWNAFIAGLSANHSTQEDHPVSQLEEVWGSGWKRAIRWLVVAFGVTLSAQIGTFLIIARHFCRAYPLGVVAGPFVVGLAAPIVAIASISLFLGMMWLPLATPFVYANHLVLFIFLKIVELFGQPWAGVTMSPPSLGWVSVYIAGCLAIAHWRWVWEHRDKAVLIGAAVLAIWIWDAALKEEGNLLDITFLDVGQGDAAFVGFPDGKTMIIDGGANRRGFDSGERVLDPFFCHKGVFSLDLLVLSHPDNDHGGGLAHILRTFDVKRVLGVPHESLPPLTHRHLHQIVDTKGIPHVLGDAGKIQLTPTAQLALLHPLDETSVNLMDEDTNNDSLVLKMTYGSVRVLFTGDIKRETELALISNGYDLRAEFLKVPHHGSETSSSSEFLEAVRPQEAIFSVGTRNRYGFPSEKVVNRYQKWGCRVLRTDKLGAIRLRTDGRRCWITHYGER
jgi:competence protein ComEC